MGVTYRFRQPSRRARRVLQHGDVVGGRRRRIPAVIGGEAAQEGVIDRHDAHVGKAVLPARTVGGDDEEARPAIVETQGQPFGPQQREERDRDRAPLQRAEHRAVKLQ
jgi:hypothetical protein